jgi:hypothetical protein
MLQDAGVDTCRADTQGHKEIICSWKDIGGGGGGTRNGSQQVYDYFANAAMIEKGETRREVMKVFASM